MNGNTSSSEFSAFWLELNEYLEEVGPAVQERHYDETMCMPAAISVNHLREVISSRLREKSIEASIPSASGSGCNFSNAIHMLPLHYGTLVHLT